MGPWLTKLKDCGRPLKAYERHLSALAMVGGFIFDNYAYGRVDHPVTQTLLLVYIAVAAGTIVWLHYLEDHPDYVGIWAGRLRSFLPVLTQFAFGSLWSAFLVFYTRSGVFASSWPFFILLLAIFVTNEVLRSYHTRLIFTSVLLAFALLSYAIFMVPVFTHSIGREIFLYSGLAAAAVFLLFIMALRLLGRDRWHSVHWPVLRGAVCVFAVVNALYFLEVLPPLPLAMQHSGVYRGVRHTGALYYATGEPQSWTTWFGTPATVHVPSHGAVYFFSAVFAPIKLSTSVQHVWQHYDKTRGEWITVQRKSYRIFGGRKNGYRGYTRRADPEPGLWRVDVESIDGRLIGRQKFLVVTGPATVGLITTVIR